MFCSVLASRDALLEFGRLVWIVMDLMVNTSSVAASDDFLVELSVLNVFVWSVAISAPGSLFLVSRFENSDSARYISLFSAKFWLRIPMDDEISIQLFCHSLDSWLRLLLRSVKVLLEFGLSGHAARDCRLGWFRDGSDGAILLLRVFWGLGMLKRPETIVVWRHWFGRSLRPGKPSNSPRWCGGRHDGAEGAISTKQYTCLHWTVNEAICLSDNLENTRMITLITFRILEW